nr:ABC transporter ATP-binding protein [Aestuariispira insulae]
MLALENIETFYGPSQALHGVSLEIGEGEMVALLGRNGMGKTTTVRSICNLSQPKRGTIRFSGTETKGLPAYKVARLGIGLVPEGRRCFPNLSVWENLVATERAGSWTLEKVYDLFPRLKERANQSAQTLSGGEQQMLAVGRALMTNPKLLILDEATEGLAPLIRQEIWSAIRTLKAAGQATLIIDKTLKELLPIADRCVILEKGRDVWTGTPDALSADRDLQDRFLGV